MFSKRSAWALEPNRLALRVAEHRRSGRALVDLTASNPTHVGLSLPEAELRAALAEAATLVYEPEPLGRREAREAVSRLYGGAVPPERIALCASTSEAYAWCLKLLCEPGDRVLVPVPGYPLIDHLATLEGVGIDHVPLFLAGDRFAFDWADLEGRIGDRTRAIVLASPNFPTGTTLRREELARLAQLCARHSLALVVDEVFGEWRAGDDPEAAATAAGTDAALCLVLSGLSKTCLQPQLKLGWIAAGGPGVEVGEALRRLEAIADAYLPVNSQVERALPRLLELRSRIQAPLRERLAANRAALERLAAGGPCRLLPSQGGWSAVLRVPRTQSDEDWALHLLDEEGILVHPGFLYDFPSEGWLVLSLLLPEEVFQEAAARLVGCVGRASRCT